MIVAATSNWLLGPGLETERRSMPNGLPSMLFLKTSKLRLPHFCPLQYIEFRDELQTHLNIFIISKNIFFGQ
jgi:hypothetical protein